MPKADSPPPSDSVHTPWSDPGDLPARLHELPSDPVAIPDALENFVIHHAIARYTVERIIAALVSVEVRRFASRMW